METKTCIDCNKEISLSYFSFRTDTKKHRNQCKKCHKGYETTLEERRFREDKLFLCGIKKCGCCKEEKELKYFSIDKNTRQGLSSRWRHYIKKIKISKKDVI